MIRRRIKRLPVLRGETLVGVIARSDLLKGLLAATPRGERPHIPTPRSRPPSRPSSTSSTGRRARACASRFTNGAVTFDGAITDERLREGLKVIAENTPGCVAVHDHMAWIEPNSGFVMPSEEDDPKA